MPNKMLLDLVEVSSFHATGAAATSPGSGSGQELYVAPASLSTIQCYNRSTSSWLDMSIAAKNFYLVPQTSTGQILIGTNNPAPFIMPRGTGSLSIESPNQYLMLCSKGGTHSGGNLYWNASAWLSYDSSQPSTLLAVVTTYGAFYSAPAASPGSLSVIMRWDQGTNLVTNDTWHTVTYQNGFSAWSGWNDVQYTRTPEGLVRFRGLLASPTTAWGYTTPAFTLPVGYRLTLEPGSGYPSPNGNYHFFSTMSDSSSGVIAIYSTGLFCPYWSAAGAQSGAHWWDMSGINYMAV